MGGSIDSKILSGPDSMHRERKAIFSILFHSLQRGQRAAGYQWTRKKEFWSGDEVEVIEVEVVDSEHYAQLPRILPPWEEKMTFYNCDIPLPQTYLYEKRTFSNRPMHC